MGQGINPIRLPDVGLSPELAAVGQPARTRGATTVQGDADSEAAVQAVGSLRPEFANKEITNDGYQREAQSARNADQVLHAARDLLHDINGKLEAIVKNYPPFPVDSAERLAYLNSVSGLRQQLAAMIIPPPPDAQPSEAPRLYPSQDARVLEDVKINEGLLPPLLDPKRTSDAQLAAVQDRVQNTLGTVEDFLARLQRNVQQLAQTIGNYPGGDADAGRTSQQTGRGLAVGRLGIGGDVGALI